MQAAAACEAMQVGPGRGCNVAPAAPAAAAHPVPFIPYTPPTAEVASPDDFGAFDSAGKLTVGAYPPTVFVRMERDNDGHTYAGNAARLRANGVPSDVITVGGRGRG